VLAALSSDHYSDNSCVRCPALWTDQSHWSSCVPGCHRSLGRFLSPDHGGRSSLKSGKPFPDRHITNVVSCLSDMCPSFRWRHLVNAYEVMAGVIWLDCWQLSAACIGLLSPVLNLVVVAVLCDSIGIRSLLSCVTGCCEVERYVFIIIKRIIIILLLTTTTTTTTKRRVC